MAAPAMRWVVDASVAAKWLAPEHESLQAESLLAHELAAPDLLFAELTNILWKKQARGQMVAATTNAAVHWLQQLPVQVTLSAGLAAEALRLAARLGHPACDCFYLALAIARDARLVTADRRPLDRCSLPDGAALAQRVVWVGALPAG